MFVVRFADPETTDDRDQNYEYLSGEGGQNSAEFKYSNSARICGIINTVQNTVDHLLFVLFQSYDYIFPGILGTASMWCVLSDIFQI